MKAIFNRYVVVGIIMFLIIFSLRETKHNLTSQKYEAYIAGYLNGYKQGITNHFNADIAVQEGMRAASNYISQIE